MHLPLRILLALFLALALIPGCSDDAGTGPTGPVDFSGEWVMVSMVVTKLE